MDAGTVGGTAFPLTFGQEQLLVLEQLDGESRLSFPLRTPLRGSIDPTRIASALARLVRTHDALRMVVTDAPGGGSGQVAVASRDVEPLSAGTDPALPATVAARRPLYFSVAEDADPPELVVHLHHAFVDGWSAWLLARGFDRLHLDLLTGRREPATRAGSFGAYALRRRTAATPERVRAHLAFWDQEIRDAVPVELPAAGAGWRPGVRAGTFPAVTFEVTDTAWAGLAGRFPGCSTSAVLLAAVADTFRRYTGQRDLLLHGALSDRGGVNDRALIGCLTNQCLLRVRLPGEPGLDAAVPAAARALARALRHQAGPFLRTGRRTPAGRVLDLSPKVSVAFNHGLVSDDHVNLTPGTRTDTSDPGCRQWDGTANGLSDLHVEFVPGRPEDPIRFQLVHRDDLWSRAAVGGLGVALAARLREAAGSAGASRAAGARPAVAGATGP